MAHRPCQLCNVKVSFPTQSCATPSHVSCHGSCDNTGGSAILLLLRPRRQTAGQSASPVGVEVRAILPQEGVRTDEWRFETGTRPWYVLPAQAPCTCRRCERSCLWLQIRRCQEVQFRLS